MRTILTVLCCAQVLACGAPPPASETAAAITPPPLNLPYVSPPNSAAITTDPSVCSDHLPPAVLLFGGAQACAAALASPDNVLVVWRWSPVPPPPLFNDLGQPDGYHVYVAVNGGAPALLGTQAGAVAWTELGVRDPLPTARRCFTVRAYKGTVESVASNAVCLGDPVPPPTTVTLQAQTANFSNIVFGGHPAPGGDALFVGEYTLDAGFEDDRAAMRFNVNPIANRILYTATLKFHRRSSVEGRTKDDCARTLSCAEASDTSCANELLTATTDWTLGLPAGALPDGDVIWNMPDSGVDFSLDVTNVVRGWMSGARPNNGFVLRRDYVKDNYECLSTYDGAQLVVTYF